MFNLISKKGAVFGIEFRALKKQFGELFLARMQSVTFIKERVASINTQQGAVFGIDARIALVIVSIASMAIVLNKNAVEESRKLHQVTYDILKLSDHIMQQYSVYHDNISILNNIYAESSSVQNDFWSGADNLKYDPWGNAWIFAVFDGETENVKILGEPVYPKCILIYSAGGDNYHYYNKADSAFPQNYDECLANKGLTVANHTRVHDDYFYKFTTIEYEANANKEAKRRLKQIQTALQNYQQAEYNNRLKYCDDLDSAVANVDPLCDINSDNLYDSTELAVINFLPKSSLESNNAVEYANSTLYNYQSSADRKALLAKLGLPDSYNEDLIGRALYYHSNNTNVTTSPYVAKIYYEDCAACSFD